MSPIALPHRAVIAITGPEARVFLERVISNGPDGLAPGAAQLSSLLTPQGKVLADFILFDDGAGGLFVDGPASETEALVKRFTLYRMRADAAIAPRPDLAVVQALKGDLEGALAAAPDPRSAALGVRAIAAGDGFQTDTAAYDRARIEAGVPEFGADYGPAEVFSTDVNHDLMGGVDYKKGCFVGQEVASRMHRKGGVRKRTARLTFEREAPAPASPVAGGETPLGAITSAAGPFALARLRTDRLEAAQAAGEAITANGAPVAALRSPSLSP